MQNRYSSGKTNKENAQTIVTRRHPTAGYAVAWTDGACDPNPGPGGWGYRLEVEGAVAVEKYGGELETTNNRMELQAIIEAIADGPENIIVRTDSQLCLLCAIGRWKRKTNIDLWVALDGVCRPRSVLFEWWRGHCGTPGNERADELAEIGRSTTLSINQGS